MSAVKITSMIHRIHRKRIEDALKRQPAVAIIGPRQVGKTTLAYEIAASRPSVYLDLEDIDDREKLRNPKLFLEQHKDKLVVMDEIHRAPDIFTQLRGIIDQGRREGFANGRFLILGSASMDLLRQSESLAGRIAYIDMGALNIADFSDKIPTEKLWHLGGYPSSILIEDQQAAFANRKDLIRSYLERDIPMFAPRLPVETLERLWRMLAHHQGALLNISQLAGSLGVKSPAVNRYIGLLCDLLLVRRLEPYFINTGKRLIKTPKTYVRDSGLLHALLNIESHDDLLGHPIVGASWEGFVIENLLSVANPWVASSFYRSVAGAEIDLLLEHGAKAGTWAIEIKRSTAPSVDRGFYSALEDIEPQRAFVVYAGEGRYPRSQSVEVISLPELISELRSV